MYSKYQRDLSLKRNGKSPIVSDEDPDNEYSPENMKALAKARRTERM
jgi:hypothetical protein